MNNPQKDNNLNDISSTSIVQTMVQEFIDPDFKNNITNCL